MDKLKQLVASKRKAVEEEFGGKKFVKRGELEELRLKKLREQEEEERKQKERLKREKEPKQDASLPDTGPSVRSDDSKAVAPSHEADQSVPPAVAVLSREEVIRRLRVLKEPAVLFGESDDQRKLRLVQAESNVQVDDEAAGGQQGNLHIAIEREEKERAKRMRLNAEEAAKPAAAGASVPAVPSNAASTQPAGGDAILVASAVDEEQQRLMASFQAAAEAIAEKNLPVEERVSKWIKRWMTDWEEDLEQRTEDVKASAAGRQADVRFKETQEYMRPLYGRLRARSLDPQLLAGISLIIEAMKERNYLHAYKIYMGVAIGNSPWPIGVTQVGLHERASREKISFKYTSGNAHIMNDEATRKFIQALKRLMTFCQRRYPTDPSRSVDFDGLAGEGRGAAGAGSDKEALLAAMSRGEVVRGAPAPSYVDERGAVKIPEKWDQVLRDAMKDVAASDVAEGRQHGTGGSFY